jgi:hypothetical protein
VDPDLIMRSHSSLDEATVKLLFTCLNESTVEKLRQMEMPALQVTST